MSHAKYLSTSSCCFGMEDVLSFHYVYIWKTHEPPSSVGPILTPGLKFEQSLRRGPTDNVSCKISKIFMVKSF